MGSLLPRHLPVPSLRRKALSPYAHAMREVCFDLHDSHCHESEFEIEDDEPHQPPHPHSFWWDYFLAIPRAHHH